MTVKKLLSHFTATLITKRMKGIAVYNKDGSERLWTIEDEYVYGDFQECTLKVDEWNMTADWLIIYLKGVK